MSDINKKVQVAIEADATQAKREFAATGDAAKAMSTTVAQAGGAAAASIDKMGDGAADSSQKIDRASKSMIASIQRATAATQAGSQSTAAYFDAISKQRGLNGDALKPYIDQLRAAELAQEAARSSLGKVGVSAAQTAAALRGVPAQFTDIAVSLAAGQAPMTVLLQQGGQLKDMFGGVGAAAKALGGYVASLVSPLTVAAAAVGGLGYAYYSGSTESDEFRKNLILTGNAAGLTVDKFNTMAASLGNLSGITQGAASEALTQMAASGNISATSIEKLTQAAIQFEKAGGPAVADTVKQFEELGKNPVEASVKLSEKTHYLTLAVYEQIKALQDQGKTAEAAALAQNAWADAIDQRTPQMVDNIGALEHAWREMASTAAQAWDTLKGIGRDDTTTDEKIAKLQTRLVQAKADLANPSRARFAESVTLIEQELADLEQRTDKAVAKRAEDVQREKQRIAATAGVDSLIDSQRTAKQRYADDLKKLDSQRAADLISEEKYQQAKVALAKKYEEKPKAAKADKAENAYNSLLDSLNKQLGTSEKLNAVEKLGVELQEKKYAKLTPMQKANLQAIAAEIDAEKRWQAEGKATVSMIEDAAKAQASARRTLDDTVKSSQRNLETFGMSRSEVAAFDLDAINKQIDAERELADEIGVGSTEILRQLEERAAAQKKIFDNERGVENKQTLVNMAKAAEDAHKKAAEKAAAEWEKVADRIDQAFHDAFVKAIEAGSNGFDAFAESIKTSLKAAVADGLYQLTARPLVMSVVGAFSGAQAAPGAAAAPASLSNGFGVISGAQSLWSAYNGGVSGAAATFARSGFGQAAGLSAAPVELAGPTMTGEVLTGTALTGAGSTFAAAAAPVLGALTAAYAIAEMQKSGWGIDNDKKSGALAAVSVGTLGANVILDRLFGHNRNISNDAQGISGTFDLSGFTGQNFQERSQKGGTFRSDRRWTDYSAIDADMDKALDSMLKQAVSGVQTIGKALNVETENALQDFSHTFALQLSENGDMSKAGEKIAAELKKVQDELATRLVPNIADFARYGESASDTFARLNQEVTATDAILLAMGKDASESFGAVGMASIKAREDLIDLAGGLDKLASKTQAYYANFYTSDEQMQRAAEQAQKVLNKGFADLSLTLPTDRKGFRDLVESYGKDLSTEGARKLFNALLDLQDEFDAVADVAESDAKKLKDATTAAQQGQASLFDTFATDSQKLDAAKALLSETFSTIGQSVPASAADFLKLAQSVDPATEAGQALIAALGKVSSAFAYAQTSAATAAASVLAAQSAAASSYFSNLDALSNASSLSKEGQSAVDQLFGSVSDGAKAAAEASASAASDAAQAWKSAAQSLKSALDNVRTGSIAGLSPEDRYRLLQAQFATTSTAAMAGDQTAAGQLGQIATDFLDASRNYNASGAAFQADRAAADAALDKSLQYAQAQSSLQATIANASRAAVSELQSLNTNLSGFASQALEMLSKGGYSSGSREESAAAVTKLAQAQADFSRYFATTAEGVTNAVSLVSGQATLTRLAGDMAMLKTSSGQVEYIRAAESIIDVAKRLGDVRATWERDYGIKLPSYAVGTPFVPQDQIAQIHQGEMIIPANAASQLRKFGMSNQVDSGLQAEMLAELRATRQSQQQSYAAMQQQLAASNAKLLEMNKRLAAMEDQARLSRAGQ